LSKAQKAALVLWSLKPGVGAAIAAEMSDDALRRFARALGELRAAPPALVEMAARDFIAAIAANAEIAMFDAGKALAAIVEEARANKILAGDESGGPAAVWSRVGRTPCEEFLVYFSSQRPPVAAVMVSALPFDYSARLLAASDAAFAREVLEEVAREAKPSPQAIAAIAAAVDAEYLRPAATKPSQANAGKVIAEILSLMPATRRDTVLAEIGAGNADLATHVKRALLIFSDLHIRLDEAGAAALLRSVDKVSLLTALKAGRNNAPDAVAFLMANISKRMAEQYQEEMASMAEPDEDAADAAQRELVRAVRQLESRNELKLKPPSD
jgi:flagellar motor switch protein FliG